MDDHALLEALALTLRLHVRIIFECDVNESPFVGIHGAQFLGLIHFLDPLGGQNRNLRYLFLSSLSETLGVHEYWLGNPTLRRNPSKEHLKREETLTTSLQKHLPIGPLDFHADALLIARNLKMDVEGGGFYETGEEFRQMAGFILRG